MRPQTLTLTEALPDDYDDDDGDDAVPVVVFRPERQINQTIDRYTIRLRNVCRF